MQSPDSVPFAESFWEFVYSEDWKDFSAIRVCEGTLLDRLLCSLHRLTDDVTRQITTYKVARFDTLQMPVKNFMKKRHAPVS